jgi:hypothetical protein
MPDHMTRDERVVYDHESERAPRRRQADDWGIDTSFPRVRGRRFARGYSSSPAPARSRRRPVEDWSEPGEPVDEWGEPGGPEVEWGLGVDEPGAPEAVALEEPAVEVLDTPEPSVQADGRRTIRIYGRPGELSEAAPFVSTARRRPPRTVEERLAGDPTRIIAWGFALGVLLILIAILTA